MTTKKKRLLGGVAAVVLVIQVIPFGRNHANPPVTQEPAWDSPATRELARRACFDCHSNETRWPWYSNIAPVSWLIQSDVDGGRSKLNFSEFDRPQHDADEAPELVRNEEMPLPFYIPFHAEAKLSDTEREALAAGLEATARAEGLAHGAVPDQPEETSEAE